MIGRSVVKMASNSGPGRPWGCSESGGSRIRSTTLTTRTLSSGRYWPHQVGRGERLDRGHVAGARQHHVGVAWSVEAQLPDARGRGRSASAAASMSNQDGPGCLPATTTLM
jgi:hypothetical protein